MLVLPIPGLLLCRATDLRSQPSGSRPMARVSLRLGPSRPTPSQVPWPLEHVGGEQPPWVRGQLPERENMEEGRVKLEEDCRSVATTENVLGELETWGQQRACAEALGHRAKLKGLPTAADV